MDSSFRFADLLVIVGFLAYLLTYILCLAYAKIRAIGAGRSLRIIDVFLSVFFAMALSTIVFMVICSIFDEGTP